VSLPTGCNCDLVEKSSRACGWVPGATARRLLVGRAVPGATVIGPSSLTEAREMTSSDQTSSTALAIGASRGFGRAIASALHAEGAKVVAVARNAELLAGHRARCHPGRAAGAVPPGAGWLLLPDARIDL
jgi:hypothetical protein